MRRNARLVSNLENKELKGELVRRIKESLRALEGFITLVDSLFKLKDLAGLKEIEKQEERKTKRKNRGVMSELEIAQSQMQCLEKANKKLKK